MQHLSNFFKNLSIMRKFMLSLFVLILFPMLVIFLFINNQMSVQFNREACETNLEILKQSKTSLINFVKDVEFVSLNILGDKKIQNLIKIYRNTDDVELAKMDVSYSVQSILDSRSYINGLSVYDDKSIIFQFGKLVMNEDRDLIPAIAALRGKVYWTDAYINQYSIHAREDKYEISLLRVINDLYSMNRLGYERISVLESYICSLYSGIIMESGSEMFIVTETGSVISSTDKDSVGKLFKYNDYVRDIKGSDEGWLEIESSNQLFTYYKIPKPHWYVVKIDDTNVMFTKSYITLNLILVCIFLTLCFGFIFAIIQQKTVINPIVNLSKQVCSFKEHDFTYKPYYFSKDEIGALNVSFGEMIDYINDLIEKEYRSKIREKDIELKYLQSQINPHFLYNTLDSIRWMAMKQKQYDIAEQVEALAKIFRHALNLGNEMTTIGEEIEHLKDYMVIQKNRFGDIFKVDISVDKNLLKRSVLKLILQPLVENAITHGLEQKVDGGKIDVKIYQSKDVIYFVVSDNGVGCDENKILDKLNNGKESYNVFALKNIMSRIKKKYGEQYGIEFQSKKDAGTKVTVTIPAEDIC